MTAPAKDRDNVVAEGGARVGAAARAAGTRARRRADAATTIAWAAARAGFDLPVRVRAWDGSEAGPAGPPTAVLRSPRALRRALWAPGELGLARAYVSGDLDVEGDLTEGLRRAFRAARPAQSGRAWGGGASDGRATGGRVSRGRVSRGRVSRGRVSRGRGPGAWAGWGPGRWADVVSAAAVAASRLGVLGPPPAPPASEIRLSGRAHSRARDRAVIAGHYDLPVSFYRLILDPAMAYSCGYWTGDGPGYGLADAQRDKLDLVADKLRLGPGVSLLDLGCGWGSLTVHAAQHRQARVSSVTLSAEQGGYTRERLRGLGLADRAQVLIQDYRDTTGGPYDAIASLEMGEHVGADGYPAFCAALHRLLRPGGRLLIQQMSRGRNAPGGGAFIESYVTADMHMRPVGETVGLLEDAGLEVLGVQALRPHYVRTIRAWLGNLEDNLPAVEAIIGRERARMWRLYLAGGALAFEEGRMGVDQILAARPE
jgi:cyclopropane-fatty-acyl-phospholipid synthase